MSIYKKIILVPRLNNAGGVAHYYKTIKPYLSENTEYLYRGRKEKKANSILRFIQDYSRFFAESRKNKKDGCIIINTSLGSGSFYRDGFYSLLCPSSAKKIIFFRGWDPAFQKKIERSKFLRVWLQITFLKADHIIVLSSRFKERLFEWGYKKEISLETTLVDENLLRGFAIKNKTLNTENILFLSAVTKGKGIMEALEAFHLLRKKNTQLAFHIAGDGSAMPAVKENLSKNKTNGVNILGYVRGDQKAEVFKNAGVFLFPSYHEGMPNAVLEAMAFGLPVITTRVGGLPDFFEDGKMGLFLDNHNPGHIAEKVQYLLDRPELMKQMSEYNYHYAKERFYASKVAKRLEAIIESVVDKSA